MADSEERTEDATEKRKKENREKGKLQKSQDVTAWLGVGVAAVMLPATIGLATMAATGQMLTVAQIAKNPTLPDAIAALGAGLGSIIPTTASLLAAVFVAVLAGAALQGGIQFRTFTPKYEQFDLVKGTGRVFGMQALWNGVKSLLKTAVVGLVLFTVVQGLLPTLTTAGGLSVSALLAAAADGTATLMVAAVAAGLVLAAADVFVVWKRNRKQSRMTKKEVRDENKSAEGDPLIKGQRRSRQLAMSRNRMIAAVGDADVVIVNPTHVAIALRYEPGKSAPRLVAKGKGIIAARIREEAEKKGVPMVKDVPLARAIHAACDLGQEIPVSLYNAVATVLTFVAALKARGAARGIHALSTPVPVPGGAS